MCRLLITFANILDPDQAQQNVGPDLDPNYLTLKVFIKEFVEQVDFEKNQHTTKMHEKFPREQRDKVLNVHLKKHVYISFTQLCHRFSSLDKQNVSA